MRRHISGQKLAIAIVIVVILGVSSFISVMLLFSDRVDDVYAGEWAASMIVQHIETHDGQWPQDWEDLETAYVEIAARERVIPFELEDLKNRIEVDFTADPAELVKASDPPGDDGPFEVVWHKSGERRFWRGQNPNSEIWNYLRSRRALGLPIGDQGAEQAAGEDAPVDVPVVESPPAE